MIRPFDRFIRMIDQSASSIRRTLDRVRSHEGGATAVTFVMVMLPLVVVTGAGADFYAMHQRRVDLQSTVDGAVMAGAMKADEGAANGVITKTVADYVTASFDKRFDATSTVNTTVDTNLGQVGTAVVTTMNTTFLKVIGIKTLTYQAKAAANFGGGLLEVALAIDVTGSMDGTKLTAAKAAAKDLVKTLFTVPGTNKTNDKVRIGLVPFARYVNIGTSYRGQAWLDVAADSKWTTQECWNNSTGYCAASKRVTGTCYNDGTPYTCSWDQCTNWVSGTTTRVCGPVAHSTTWYGCVGSRNTAADLQAEASAASKIPGLMDTWCNATLVRLTKAQGTLNSAIDNLWASDETYIAPGMLWAWRLLSSKAPFADGSTNSTTTKKAIILMTDGANTVSATPPYHWGSDVTASNTMLSKTCTSVKTDNITIYTIAFDVTDAGIKSILTNCATSPSNFYDAANVSQMTSAFKQIGAQLSSRRLVY
jgi:Flp pilus assembly protein TadG